MQNSSRPIGPWPQPSPRFPDEDVPTVFNFSDFEKRDFATWILSRYAKQICLDWLPAAKEAFTQTGLEEVTDREFADYFEHTTLAKFLNPVFEAIDKKVFSQWLKARKAGGVEYYKVDFTPVKILESVDPTLHMAPSVSLFRRGGDGELACLAIRMNGLTIRPENEGAWELAKYFVLQGASLTTTILAHPKVHFPMDTINAVTKSILPATHIVHRLFEPHMRFTLPLNHRVQWSEHSILTNDQERIYAPYPSTGASNCRFKAVSFSGLEGNSSYPKYSFAPRPAPIHAQFGQFIDAYYETILSFTRKVCQHIDPRDPDLKLWAKHISKILPGFPNEKQILKGECLAEVLAFYIHDVSVVHAAEHYTYSTLPIRKAPLRLRVPPPQSLDMAPVDRKKLNRSIDLFRHQMAWRIFFTPTNLTLLKESKYRFEEPVLQKAARQFIQDLKTTERSMPTRNYIPLDQISASIQY